MEKKNIIIFAVVGVVIMVAIIVGALRPSSNVTPPEGSSSGSTSGSQALTRTPVPTGAVAPSEGTTKAPSGVAIPSIQVAAAPDSDSSYRSFAIKITNDTYTPGTVIVNRGDTVNLELTAIDANYGFTQPDYGLSS